MKCIDKCCASRVWLYSCPAYNALFDELMLLIFNVSIADIANGYGRILGLPDQNFA